MSVSYIPQNIKFRLWGKAAGRCQYRGCNKELWLDPLTKAEFNTSYIAHIIADKPKGPRGNTELSEKLKQELSNLMLMCDEHHRLIDKVDVDGHGVSLLQEMKKEHEDRMQRLTSIKQENQSYVLLYGAKIGEHDSLLTWQRAANAMALENKYPAEAQPIEIGLKNSCFKNDGKDFWKIEVENLRVLYDERVKRHITSRIHHLSVCGLAPIPLLIELGRLISDIMVADIYQLHKEPTTWEWHEDDSSDTFQYYLQPPDQNKKVVAINMSLSATIDNSRITSVLGEDTSIWTFTIDKPNNDYLKSKKQLTLFREAWRQALNEIKARHGQNTILHIFPAIPVSPAIEVGRVWQPKADMAMKIYDQNNKLGGFVHALTIGEV